MGQSREAPGLHSVSTTSTSVTPRVPPAAWWRNLDLYAYLLARPALIVHLANMQGTPSPLSVREIPGSTPSNALFQSLGNEIYLLVDLVQKYVTMPQKDLHHLGVQCRDIKCPPKMIPFIDAA